MGVRAFILGTVALLLATVPSAALVRIGDDPGGRIGSYLEAYAMLRSTGQFVVIDGACLSACTLVLGMIPSERVCVTPRARLGFHAAWTPDENGRPVRSPMGTRVLMDIYPPKVRNWIRRKGGLTHRMIFLQGRELAAMYRPCR
jgi:hypothetical protein